MIKMEFTDKEIKDLIFDVVREDKACDYLIDYLYDDRGATSESIDEDFDLLFTRISEVLFNKPNQSPSYLQGYLAGLVAAKGIIMHSNDRQHILETVLAAIGQAENVVSPKEDYLK